MQLTPDATIIFSLGPLDINATLVFTWLVMAVLTGVSLLVSRKLQPDAPPSLLRGALEVVVKAIEQQVSEVTDRAVRPVLYFAGTLFLFVAASNLLLVVPGFQPPTGSLSTTVALTITILLAVPVFSIRHQGLGHYLRQFIQPTWLLLPFNLIGEFSKAISLSIRLYGNVMSGAVIAAILLGVAPFFFPVLMEMLGLITGLIQAYIFSILAAVYIASALASPEGRSATKS
ncbi:MAG: F0F1 ATP synthase subunit A [Desulfomicrobium sp.]|jgi:F-type H+-transporting ATPase subunit a|nr:F0F1 ATP synthase subunit A [Desulfomicrobium sp.]NLV96470.1 F0F1 ATP synthase subunit A [Desulfovibrionales bacterium]